MSYDVSLYKREFLKRAIENNLGDWTGADPIPEGALQALVHSLKAAGFIRCPTDKAFADFARQEGVDLGEEFLLDTAIILATVTVFPGQVAFSIPYGPRCEASVAFCVQLAKRWAAQHALAYQDPQTGEAAYE